MTKSNKLFKTPLPAQRDTRCKQSAERASHVG